MAVVFHHSGASRLRDSSPYLRPIANLLTNGQIGVSFFFVLSGFILQHVYRGKLDEPFAMRRYGWARVARVYPVYLLALSLTALFVADASWRALPQLVLLQCWAPSQVLAVDNWNFPAWTLSAEFFFYLLFPFVSMAVGRWGAPTMSVSIAALALFMLTLQTPAASIGTFMPMSWMFWVPLPLLRLPEFLFGVLLGELSGRGLGKGWRVPPGLLAAIMVTVLCASTLPVVAPIVTILAGALVFRVAQDDGGLLTRALTCRLPVLLGGASYSIYLLATPVRLAFRELGVASLASMLCFPVVLIGAGVFVFHVVEEPCRSWLGSRGTRRFVGPA